MIILKKRKTYEISVIDKTYSKIISDETKFYTSDTALELGFELKETEYTFESAEIVLLNIDDRSLVTRPVAKSLDSFAYELDDDIIAHYGDWRGQVRFEQTGETYVSSPVKFRIENDLSNERPPQLSDVQSWVSLKRYADDLIDELKQAVLSIEGIEDTFNENETGRQNQFETAEQSRQTTFETNESERDETFESNETTRQAQELEREKAEDARQTVFEDNEAIRIENFNDNEATRQVNETARQQAETQRVTAESSRTSAEAQRKIDHANRSAELAGKADKKQEDWITVPLFNGVQHGNSPLKVMKDEMGVVHFKGSLTNLATGNKAFTVPVAYRPDIGVTESWILIPISTSSSNVTRTLQINYLGDGYTSNTSNTVVSYFDGVSYVAKRG